jgi:putative ABC transport system ATP-binding protein
MNSIEIKNVQKKYIVGDDEFFALKKVNFTMRRGEFVAVMGRSGSGKSTFLNIVGCLTKATRGEYHMAGKNVNTCTDDELSIIRSRKIGFIFQHFNLIPNLNLYDNVSLPFLYTALTHTGKDLREKTLKVIKMVGLAKKIHHKPHELSGGEMQRAAIARALVNDPELILADEPTGNLDSHNGEIIMDIIGDINNKGDSIILVTHDEKVAARAEKIMELKDGQFL